MNSYKKLTVMNYNIFNSMSTSIAICIMTLFTYTSMSQDMKNLDNKYGINKFKLETPFSIHKSSLILDDALDQSGKIKLYIYKDSDLKTLFGYDLEKITLGYYKDKLYTINFEFNDNSRFNKDNIYGNLQTLFGSGKYNTNVKSGPLFYEWLYSWTTSKTILYFGKSKDEPAKIWMNSEILYKQMLNEEF